MRAQERNVLGQNVQEIEADAGRLISAGGEVDLRSWLEVDWFYPEGFKPVAVTETHRAFLAFGEREVLKFLKSEGVSAEQRWSELADEIGDNLPFAPGAYRGIRALRWADGEAKWIGERGVHERAAADLKSARRTYAADEFAIAMRRLPDKRRLDNLLFTGSDPDRALLALATSLVRHHRRGIHWGKKLFESDTETILELFYEKYVSELRSFLLLNGSYLDSFSRTIFLEIVSAIEREFSQLDDLFVERGMRGVVTDGHGDLRLDRIWYEVRGGGTPELSILGRMISRARMFGNQHGCDRTFYRFADALDDIAAVSIDLRCRGNTPAAEKFEQMISNLHPQVADSRMLRFFLMVHSVRRAMRSLDLTLPDDRILNSETLLQSRAAGLRSMLGIGRPFVLAFPLAAASDIGSDEREKRHGLMRSAAELIDAPIITIDQAAAKLRSKARSLGPFHRLAEDELALNEWVIEEVAGETAAGNAVVTEWPTNNPDAQEKLAGRLAALDIPLLVVHCQLGRAEFLNRTASRGLTTDLWHPAPQPLQSIGLSPAVASLIVEPTAAAPDQALVILRELAARIAQKIN